MKQKMTRKIAALLAVITLLTSVWTPVYGAVEEAEEYAQQAEAAAVRQETDAQGVEQEPASSEESAADSVEELEDKLNQAAENLEQEINGDVAKTYANADGTTTVRAVTDALGDTELFIGSDEELVYDESKADSMEDLEYVGTSSSSGISLYRQTLDAVEAMQVLEEAEEEDAEFASELSQITEEYEKDLLTEEQLAEAIEKADAFSEEIRGTYFRRKDELGGAATPSEAAAEKKALKTATPSDASAAYALTGASGEDAEDGDGEASEEEYTCYDNNMDGSDYVMILEPESLDEAEGGYFESADIVTDPDGDEEDASLTGADLAGSTAEHTELSANVMIVRKDWVYFQINTLDKNGKRVGGADGASIYLTYPGDGDRTVVKEGISATQSGHKGYCGFDGMKGTHYCFLNISLPGYAIQTYCLYALEGGKVYTFDLRPVSFGEVYLRGAYTDNVDILHGKWSVALGENASVSYDFKYLLACDQGYEFLEGLNRTCLRVVPKRTNDLLAKNRRKYRDRIFYSNNISTYQAGKDEHSTKSFTISAQWSKMSDFIDCPDEAPAEGDDVSKVRLTPGCEVYIDLPEGYTWAENGTRSIKLNVSVEESKTTDFSWDKFTFNLLGGDGTSIEIDSGKTGLKNGKFEVGLLKSRVTATVSPRGYGVFGYNAIVPFYNILEALKCKDKNEAYKPAYDYKFMSPRERIRSNMDFIDNKYESLRNSVIEEKKHWIWSATVTVVPSIVGVFEYDKKEGRYSADVIASISVIGAGSVTFYYMVGPVPLMAGVKGSITGSVSGAVGISFREGFQNVQISDATGLTLGLTISMAAYAGVGLHGVLCAEVTGGGFFDFKLRVTQGGISGGAPFTICGGWNVGYQVNLLYASWKADFISGYKQFYPKKDSSLSYASAEASEGDGERPPDGENTDASLLGADGTDDQMYIEALEAEGKAGAKTSGSQRMALFESNAVIKLDEDADVYRDELQVSETKKLAGGISVSNNLQYVGNDGSRGALFRIANVETVCSDGKIRVIPRLVTELMVYNPEKKDTDGTYYAIDASQVSEDDASMQEWERGLTYGYDYSFSVVSVGTESSRTVYCAAITSGPENQADLEQAAVEEALKKGEDAQKALMECRTNYQHLRLVWFDTDGNLIGSRVISKTAIPVYMREIENYAYLGTPTVICNGENFDNWWAASMIGTDVYETGGLSNGYVIAEGNRAEGTYISQQAVLDGKIRSNISLAYRFDNTDMEKVMVVSVVSDSETEEYSKYFDSSDGEWLYSRLSSDRETILSSMNSIARDEWTRLKAKQAGDSQYISRIPYKTRKFSSAVINLGHDNQDTMKPLYFTCGGSLYRFNDDIITELKITDGEVEAPQIPESDNAISYYSRKLTSGQEVLSLVSAYNVIKQSGSEESAETEDPEEMKSDLVLSLAELKETSGGSGEYKTLSRNETTMPDRYGYMITGALYKEDASDDGYGLKIYYLANAAARETAAVTSGISSLKKTCDMYVFYWKADYGVKITSLTAPVDPVDYDSKKFTMKLTYKNVGPKAVPEGVMVDWYVLNNGVESGHTEVELSGSLLSGQSGEGSFEVPIQSDWNGWIKVCAAITKVKVNGKWLESNEAGYKPYWVTSEDLAGKMLLESEIGKDLNLNLQIKMMDGISRINNVRIKAYRQKISGIDENGSLTFSWEAYPYMLVTPRYLTEDSTLERNQHVVNIPLEMTGSDGWFSGFYTDVSNKNQVSSLSDTVYGINYSEVITGFRFELVGYGDDTSNVVYDTEEISNPYLSNLSFIEVRLSDADAGYAEGTGYYYSDENTQVKAEAVLYTGYAIDYWQVDDGTETYRIDKEDPLFTYIPDNYGYSSQLLITGVTTLDEDYLVVKVRPFVDSETGEEVGTFYAQTVDPDPDEDKQDLPETLVSDGVYQYAWKFKKGGAMQLSLSYDYHDWKFKGWYRYSVNSEGEEVLADTPLSTETELDLTYADWHKDNITETVWVKPVFEKQNNPIITFDPRDGNLIGLEDAATDDSHRLTYAALTERTCEKDGYRFKGWVHEDNTAVTTYDVFEANETVYAWYEPLNEHTVTVISNVPEYGSVEMNGQVSDSITDGVYQDDRLYLYALPNSYPDGYLTSSFNRDKAYRFTGWKVYEYQDGGSSLAESAHLPEVHEVEGYSAYYTFDVQDKDWLIVAEFEREESTNYNLVYLKTDMGEDGCPMADLSIRVYPGEKVSTAHKVNSNLWELQYDSKKYFDWVYMNAALREEYEDAYTLEGWYTYSYSNCGEIVLGEKIDSNLFTFRRDGDVFLYAKWKKKTDQKAYFKKSQVTIDTETSGKINTLYYERGNVEYSCDDPSVVEIDSKTGQIGTPQKSGTVTVTAKVSGDGSVLAAEASYRLIIKKAEQYAKFDKSYVVADLDAGPFQNYLNTKTVSTVRYSSDNTDVVTVDEYDGTVTPLKRGTATITANVWEGLRYYAASPSYAVKVYGRRQQLRFASSRITRVCGDADFTNELTGAEGFRRFTSSNTDVAEVSPYTGTVHLKQAGTTVITVTSGATDLYESASASYRLVVTAAQQELVFEEDVVEKTYGDAPFVNKLTGDQGTVSYVSSDPQVASVNAATGLVTINGVGDAVITATAAATGQYAEKSYSYVLCVEKAGQNPVFEDPEPKVSYGTESYRNELADAFGTVTYTMISEMTAQGISDEDHVAELDESTGELIIENAGTITIRADIAGDSCYKVATASYVLKVEPKSIKADSITFAASKDSLRIFDGTLPLIKGRDYTVTAEEVDDKTLYRITGKGNYQGTETVLGGGSEQFVLANVDAKISENISGADYKKAREISKKVRVTGLDMDKVPRQEILESLITEGSLTEEELDDAISVGFVVNVDVELESMDDAAGKYVYSLKPQVAVLLTDADLFTKLLVTDLDPEWFDEERNILVTLGIGDILLEPGFITHVGDDGKVISTYTPGTKVTRSTFLYSKSDNTVTVAVEHFSSIVITHEDEEKAEEERRKQEEEKKRQEEEAKKKQEEEAKKKQEEEEAAKKKQEEEAAKKKQEEEAAKKKQEEQKQSQSSDSSSGGGSGSSGGGSGPGVSSKAAAAGGTPTFSSFWIQNTSGQWQVWNKATMLRSVWFCDDAVPANGKNVWYLIGADGNMKTAGLVKDDTGNYYSLETNHNGYYGMLRYKSGTYDCNGQQVYLEFEQNHNGAFGAIKNADGLAKLKAIYGETQIGIGNSNIVYSSDLK